MGGLSEGIRTSALKLAAGAIVVGALFTAPPALAAPSVEILSPKDGARAGSDVVARVVVKGRRFRAYLDGKDVTSAFSGSGRVRTAHLSVGDELRLGEASLFVRAGKRFRGSADSARFEVTRRDDSILSLRKAPSARADAGVPLRGKTRKTIERLRIKLNGKRIHDQLARPGRRSFEGSLGAHNGLRYGRNRLQIKATQRGGLFAIRDIRFKVPRKRPLVGAGPDREGSVRSTLRLDGESTEPVSDDRELSYAWRLTERPPGSSAELTDSTSAQPSLTPDLPGTYLVRLAASHPGGRAALDDVSVTAAATDDVLGLPLQTITDEGGIQIGQPGAKGSTSIGRFGSWVQLVQIDPSTGGLLDKTVPQSFSTGQSGQLLNAVRGTSRNALVILTGQGLSQAGSGSSVSENLEAAIETLGGTVSSCKGCPTPTPNGAEDLLRSGDWSLVGQRGLERGYATQNFATSRAGVPGFMGGARGSAGSINGYLGKITTVGYQFVSAEYAAIDTKYTPNPTDAPPQNQNTVAVTLPDGTVQTHPSSVVGNGELYWQVVVLDQSDLHPLANETWRVMDANGFIDLNNISNLDSTLNRYVRQSNATAGAAPLVIIQEVGSHGGAAWPGGSSVDWLQDTLPSTDSNTAWDGGNFPNAFSSLATSWNRANGQGLGSVAGNIGILTGTSGHDVVANYRRPYWDGNTNSVNNHDQSGLTVIATANAYQRSSAFLQPQPDGSGGRYDTGRIAGILRRNEQSQWELGTPSSNAGFSELGGGGAFDTKAFWDLTFTTEPKPFPCSAEQPVGCILTLGQPPPSSQDLANAELDIARALLPGLGVTSVRDQYPSQYVNAQSLLNTLRFQLGCPSNRTGGYSCDTWNALADQIEVELSMLVDIDNAITNWKNFFTYTVNKEQILTTAANKVKGNLESVESKVLRETARGVDVGGVGSDALHILTDLIEGGIAAGGAPEVSAIIAPTVGAISSATDLGDEVSTPQYGANLQQAVANDTEAINARVSDLEQALSDRYSTLTETLTFLGSVFAGDFARLQAASQNFRGIWAFTVGPTSGETTNRMAQAANVAAIGALYEATLPIAFRQWIISPRYSRNNGLAALDLPRAHTYQCVDINDTGGNDPNPGNRDPIRKSTPTSSQTSVGWYGKPSLANPGAPGVNGPSSNYTVRFLKSAADDLRPERYELTDTADEVGVQHTGTDAPGKSLINPLFQPVNIKQPFMDPVSIGMSKDEFFGLPNWTIDKLQCGTSDGF